MDFNRCQLLLASIDDIISVHLPIVFLWPQAKWFDANHEYCDGELLRATRYQFNANLWSMPSHHQRLSSPSFSTFTPIPIFIIYISRSKTSDFLVMCSIFWTTFSYEIASVQWAAEESKTKSKALTSAILLLLLLFSFFLLYFQLTLTIFTINIIYTCLVRLL